ncbi:Zinc finger MSS1 [Hyphodiscus hymeniophilus]|uniref:Zinc finger MSS1 n=1 Tax=Hyphodiscus hymeniophilus TaxID=353542 RepID=A0A9P6VKI4_9HELO|nr:Zinc finger MSS1 [Hyphodiscus hymeniophilus]
MATRPNIPARNCSGKQVSLLNDDSAPIQEGRPVWRNPQYNAPTGMMRSESNNSRVSTASSPRTPGLLRSDSYDSQTTNDPVSPITPGFMTDYERQPSYANAAFFKAPSSQYDERTYEYPPPYPTNQHYSMRPAFPDSRTSHAESQYDEDAYHQTSERGTKRYPCRYRDTHHCEKTFTTSGHASRHSKIHTAEKAVHCTYQGCHKKFTRADNMKQHLETHYKSKNGATQKAPSKSSLTTSAGIRKSAPPARSSRPPSCNMGQAEYTSYDPALYAGSSAEPYAHATHSASPIVPYGSLDLSNVHGALMSRPMAARTELSSGGGLDVLANIAALQS